MERDIKDLDAVVDKLVRGLVLLQRSPNLPSAQKRQFQRMNVIVDNLEGVYFDAYKVKGWQFVQEPLWLSWSLERFGMSVTIFACRGSFASHTVTALSDVLAPYHRSLEMHVELVQVLRSHDATFEASRQALAQWAAQPYLEDHSWEAQWEDLCTAEIDRWNGPK